MTRQGDWTYEVVAKPGRDEARPATAQPLREVREGRACPVRDHRGFATTWIYISGRPGKRRPPDRTATRRKRRIGGDASPHLWPASSGPQSRSFCKNLLRMRLRQPPRVRLVQQYACRHFCLRYAGPARKEGRRRRNAPPLHAAPTAFNPPLQIASAPPP